MIGFIQMALKYMGFSETYFEKRLYIKQVLKYDNILVYFSENRSPNLSLN